MLNINAGEFKNKQNLLSATNRYLSNDEKNQMGYNLLQNRKADISSKDSLTISAEGVGLLQSDTSEPPFITEADKQNQLEALRKSYQEQLKSCKKAKSAFEDMAKLMEIARRIARGDKVPAKDERKLMEFNSELYQAAKAAAMLHANKKHKEHKSMFDEEENNNIKNKLNSLEQEDKKEEAQSDEAAVDTGTVNMEESAVE